MGKPLKAYSDLDPDLKMHNFELARDIFIYYNISCRTQTTYTQTHTHTHRGSDEYPIVVLCKKSLHQILALSVSVKVLKYKGPTLH